LSHFTRSPSKRPPTENEQQRESITKHSEPKENNSLNLKKDETVSKPIEERSQNTDPIIGQDSSTAMEIPDRTSKEKENMSEFNIDDKQLDYIKKLQVNHLKDKVHELFDKPLYSSLCCLER
jgi:hypothetical protein